MSEFEGKIKIISAKLIEFNDLTKHYAKSIWDPLMNPIKVMDKKDLKKRYPKQK